MDNIFSGVFSEYTVNEVAFKPKGAATYTSIDGAGSAQEEYERRTISKAKSNVVVKKIARGAGSGTLTLSLHMPLELYNKLQGMLKGSDGDVVEGVYAYNARAKVPTTEIAMCIEDEDGDLKYKYFPCAASSAFSRSVDSEADTVAEVSMTFDLSVDAFDQIMYEALKTDLDTAAGTITSANWMTSVSSEALQAEGATGATGATGETPAVEGSTSAAGEG